MIFLPGKRILVQCCILAMLTKLNLVSKKVLEKELYALGFYFHRFKSIFNFSGVRLRIFRKRPSYCDSIFTTCLRTTRLNQDCYFLVPESEKLGVVISARVHPGETNASWMLKGMLDFLTSGHYIAEVKHFISLAV